MFLKAAVNKHFMTAKNVALCLCLICGCGKTDFVQSDSAENPGAQRELSEDQYKSIQSGEKVILSFARLPMTTVGLAQTNRNTVPAIQPGTMPHPHVFFQIFRCQAHKTIQGVFETYDPYHPAIQRDDSAKDYFSRNRFWDDIERNCTAVSIIHPQREALDINSPSGSWKWMVRACVANSNTHEFLCNAAISASQALVNYQNNFNDYQSKLIDKINKKIDSINQLSMNIPERSRSLLLKLEACDSSTWNKAQRALYKSVLLNIVGLGAAIAFEIFGPGETRHSSWQEKLKTLWSPAQNTQIQGQAITRILLWLFSNENDFYQSCYAAEELRVQTLYDVLQLKKMQLELADDLDEAEKLSLPLPSGILR